MQQYVTYSDLLAFAVLIVAIISLVFTILMFRMAGVEPQSVYDGRFVPALCKNPREYDSIRCGFFAIRRKSTRHKLLRTENERFF